MEETRIDRIERYLAEFIQGMKEERAAIAELRESQKKTDEQIEKTSKKVEEVSKKLGELGITDGRVAEDLFCRNVRKGTKGQVISLCLCCFVPLCLLEDGAMLVNRKNFRAKEF